MGGVMQTTVLLQARHHHENVHVVLADGKRSTSYIISIYDGIKLAPIKRSLPSMPKVTSILRFFPLVDYNQITPNRANKKETTETVQHIKSNTKRRDNKTKNSVPLARACNTPNPRENELNPVTKTKPPPTS